MGRSVLSAVLGRASRDRAQWVGGALVVAVMLVLGWWSPLAGPGYESALVAGLVCPATAAIVASLALSARPRQPLGAFCYGLWTGLRLALLAYAVTLVHGLRVGLCDFWGGSELFALGPGLGAVLAGVWGAGGAELGLRIERPRHRVAAAVALGLAGPLGSITLQLVLFYATPMVFAYDPFVGYFSGAFYDTVLDAAALRSYRAASLATLFACYALALHLERSRGGSRTGRRGQLRLRLRPGRRPGLLLVGALCGLGSLISVVRGKDLGQWQTAASIATELGARTSVGRCTVIYARTLRARDAQLFAADCDAHMATIGRWLGSANRQGVTAYLFADAGQKRQLMGAAGVSIAKPWRREIYVHASGYPHGSLGHELAHVLVGEFGRGPFQIAARLGGWLPDPGLIEGVAVAAQPARGDLTTQQWAKAMRDIGVLPSLSELFGLTFFGRHSRTAYTAAGSFVSYVHRRFGAQTVQRWYGGTSLSELTGERIETLEEAWHESLDALELSAAALVQAKARFDRPGVFSRRCPHVVDAKLMAAGYLHAVGDQEGSLELYRGALALDPGSTAALLGKASCLEQLGRQGSAAAELRAIADNESLPRSVRDQAFERLGDLALRRDDVEEARHLYAVARQNVVSEDRLRTLDIKERACDHEVLRPAVVALLIGSDRFGPDNLEALDHLGRWRLEDPEDGVIDYLLARQYLDAGRYELAARRLDSALGQRLDIERVRTEALRLRLRAACAVGDTMAAARVFERYAVRPGLPPARRQAAAALLERCTRKP